MKRDVKSVREGKKKKKIPRISKEVDDKSLQTIGPPIIFTVLRIIRYCAPRSFLVKENLKVLAIFSGSRYSFYLWKDMNEIRGKDIGVR